MNSYQNSILVLSYTCRIRRKSIYNWQTSQSNLCHLLKSVIPSFLSSDQQFKSLYLYNLNFWIQSTQLVWKAKKLLLPYLQFQKSIPELWKSMWCPNKKAFMQADVRACLKKGCFHCPTLFPPQIFLLCLKSPSARFPPK